MEKTQIDEKKYERLINERMKAHERYKKGMRVEIIQGFHDRPSRLCIIGNDDARSIFLWSASLVRDEYDVIAR